MRSQSLLLRELGEVLTTSLASLGRPGADPPEQVRPRTFPTELRDEILAAVSREKATREAIRPPFVKETVRLSASGEVSKCAIVDARFVPKRHPPGYERVDDLLTRGFDCAEQGDRSRAITEFRKARELAPTDRTATFQLAWNLSQILSGETCAEAINLYFELLERDFVDEHVWCNIGAILLGVGPSPVPVTRLFFEVALAIDANDTIAKRGLQMCKT